MIKTHKPRGHIWTCPSIFQNSPEIRNIHFSDCVPPPTKVLAPDQEAELAFQRTSKRRKVEKLADDYLNGVPLVIKSARIRPQALVEAVEGNERRRTGAKYSLPKARTAVNDDAGSLWEDVDDLSDLLAKATGKGRAQGECHRAGPPGPVFEAVEEEAATSACKRVRRVKAVKVSLDPSSEALRQAAALRDRRLQLQADAAPAVVSPKAVAESDPPEAVRGNELNQGPRESRSHQPPGAEWLLRRQSTQYRLSAEDIVDELSRSTFETPSRPSQAQTIQRSSSPAVSIQLYAKTGNVESSATKTKPFGTYQESWQMYEERSGTAQAQATDTESSASPAKGSYHTAPEDTQAALDIPSRPPNRTSTVFSGLADEACTKSAGRAASTNVLSPPRRRSAPVQTQSQHYPDRPAPMFQSGVMKGYSIAKLNNDTPLLWRKKGLKQASTTEFAAGSKISTAARSKTPIEQSQTMQHARTIGSTAGTHVPPVVAPALDMSFGHVSFAPALNLALADEHLNTRLPLEQGSAGKTSSVKRAIRRESLQHGAEVTRIEGETMSSQDESRQEAPESLVPSKMSTAQVVSGVEREAAALQDPQQPESQWAGTQTLLEQAHHNLFDSPVKPDIAGLSAVEEASTVAPETTMIREPLKTLSQEPAPSLEPHVSTQAMMASWSPWSPIKKLAVISVARQTEPSPAMRAPVPPLRNGLGHPPVASGIPDDSLRRRSSLRFATSSTVSPTQSRLSLPVTKAASQDESKSQGFDSTIDRRASLHRQSSSQCAQRDMALPPRDATTVVDEESILAPSKLEMPGRGMFREDSNPYRTVEELETTLLMTEMDGVWSQ